MLEQEITSKTEKDPQIPSHYLAILDGISNAAFVQDRHGVYVQCNKAFEFLTNLSRETVIGKTFFDLYPPVLAQKYQEENQKVMESTEVCRFQTSFTGIDGIVIESDIMKTPLRNGQGDIVGIMGVFSDISQDQIMKEALQRYELLFAHSRDFIWMVDPQTGQILEANQAACTAYGYSRREIRELRIQDFRVDDPKIIDSQLAEACRTGILFETVHRRKDGTCFPVQVNSVGARMGGRDVLISIIRDMTEAVKARDALRKQNEYLSMLHRTALSLINRLDVHELLEQIITKASTFIGTGNAFIFLHDPDSGTYEVKAGIGVCAEYLGQRFPANAGMNARIIATGKPVVINHYQQWPHRLHDPRLGWIEALLGMPLKSEGKVIGIIGFIGVDAQTTFHENDLQLLEDFASLASLALDNARLYSAAQTEINERKRAEEALRKSEAMTRSVMDSIHFGMVVVDPEMRILTANKFIQRQYPEADFSQAPYCYQIYRHPLQLGPCPSCPVEKTFKDGEVHEWISKSQTANGERHVRIISSPIKDETGSILAVVEITEDITERVLAEEEIRKLSQAVDQSPGAVVITDTAGRIIYVNAKFTQVTGYFLDEVRGQNLRFLKSGMQPDSFYKALWKTVKAGKEWRGEICNKAKNGYLFWSLASISPVRNLEGKVSYYLSIQQDITEKKEIEKTLQSQNIEIQNTLKKLQQTQTQLIQQEKMAGIGQLAAGVAHEINNPLGFVSSNFETLQKYIEQLLEMLNAYRQLHKLVSAKKLPSLQEAAEQISLLEKQKKLNYILDDLEPIFQETMHGIDRVSNIVKALRQFSRVEQENKFEKYDLNEGIRVSLTVARNEIKYVAEVREYLADVPKIMAIGGQVNQVLLNILINAAQAIKVKSAGVLELITISTWADEQFVYCSVEDTGTGIPEEIRKDIFNPFFTTKPVGQGTGLGLSISYDIIVNKHHGEILVESEAGVGATFTIKLPFNMQAGDSPRR